MRTRLALILPLALLACAVRAEDNAQRQQAFATCAICHMADGKGIPFAFPAIRDRTAQIALLDGGRAYLLQVVVAGLSGPLKAADASFNGIMPPQGSVLDDAQLAAALNHAIFDLNDCAPDCGKAIAAVAPVTAEEIAATKAIQPATTAAGNASLRAKLAKQHGDKWPK